MVVMTKADPTKKRTPLEISFNKCSLNSKCYIVFRPANNSYCITILQNYTKNCCQFVVNSDLMCQKPLILLGFLVERFHCGEKRSINMEEEMNGDCRGMIKKLVLRPKYRYKKISALILILLLCFPKVEKSYILTCKKSAVRLNFNYGLTALLYNFFNYLK